MVFFTNQALGQNLLQSRKQRSDDLRFLHFAVVPKCHAPESSPKASIPVNRNLSRAEYRTFLSYFWLTVPATKPVPRELRELIEYRQSHWGRSFRLAVRACDERSE